MKRTTAEANDGNRYTEGNPSLGIPATVVGGEEMNNIQEELANIVDDAGITLNGADEDQVLEALGIIIGRGGSQISQALDNNTADEDIVGAVWDKTDYKAARLFFDIFRRDDGQSANETGELFVWHNTEDDLWYVELDSKGADAEVAFGVTAAGQLRYTSNNYAGANYAGTLKVSNIITLAQ